MSDRCSKSVYDGAPYQWECRLDRDTFWYYSWDCASACIWNLQAVRPLVEAQ